MSKINATKIKAIKKRIAGIKYELEEGVSGIGSLEEIVNDAELMLSVIEEIRSEVHCAEDPETLLWVAEVLGTNCDGRDIDEDSSND